MRPGGERKERGKEGSTQTTALLRVTSPHRREGCLLDFSLKANIPREVGKAHSWVWSIADEGLPWLIWGTEGRGRGGTGISLVLDHPAHCLLSPGPACLWLSCWRFQSGIQPLSNTRTVAQTHSTNHLRPSSPWQDQPPAGTQNPASSQVPSQRTKGTVTPSSREKQRPIKKAFWAPVACVLKVFTPSDPGIPC